MPGRSEILEFDVVVLGSGIAGLSFALDIAPHASVALVTKRALAEANTRYAQGGIAAALGADDSLDRHVEDTLRAGAGLCHRDAVDLTVKGGPETIASLVARGVVFDRREDSPAGELDLSALDLTREGGHTARRVAHIGDFSGLAIEEALADRVRAEPSIRVFEEHVAVDLITRAKLARGRGEGVPGGKSDRVLGVYVLDAARSDVLAISARAVCLATGGAGKVYLYTTNPDVATGDGIAMAYRAGARVANLEFFQFHPTCLYHPDARNFLISESLRGEGGVLLTRTGSAFMGDYHAMKDLAPRDVVARAIDHKLKQTGEDCVFLDMTHHSADYLRQRFPHVASTCLKFGVDITSQPIPVVPAAHYLCGGVRTDLDGRTNIAGLYAIGETACTGLHGANRLASNSLLEGAVFGARAARSALEYLSDQTAPADLHVPIWETGDAVDADEQVVVTQSWDEIRRLMWNYVGIVRSNRRLSRAWRRIKLIQEEIREDYWRFYLTRDLVELRNIARVAELIVECALTRQESRGLHYNEDYPERDDADWLRDTVLWRGGIHGRLDRGLLDLAAT